MTKYLFLAVLSLVALNTKAALADFGTLDACVFMHEFMNGDVSVSNLDASGNPVETLTANVYTSDEGFSKKLKIYASGKELKINLSIMLVASKDESTCAAVSVDSDSEYNPSVAMNLQNLSLTRVDEKTVQMKQGDLTLKITRSKELPNENSQVTTVAEAEQVMRIMDNINPSTAGMHYSMTFGEEAYQKMISLKSSALDAALVTQKTYLEELIEKNKSKKVSKDDYQPPYAEMLKVTDEAREALKDYTMLSKQLLEKATKIDGAVFGYLDGTMWPLVTHGSYVAKLKEAASDLESWLDDSGSLVEQIKMKEEMASAEGATQK